MADTYTIEAWEHHEREKERWLQSRPECYSCGDRIQDEAYYEPEPGMILCEDCFRQYVFDNIRHEIE